MNRKTFDREILNLALEEGAEFMNKTRVTGLIREDGKIRGIKAKIDEKEEVEIRSNIVIGADGIESHVGRWAGIYKNLEPKDVSVVSDWILDGVDMDEENYLTYHQFGGYKDISDEVPSILPKGDGKVGITTQMLHSSFPTKKGELRIGGNYFIKNHPFLKKSKIIEVGGGVAPLGNSKGYTTDNVMLVGDAARHACPPNIPHGVLTALDGGMLAGEMAVEAHEKGDFSNNSLSKYEKRYYRLHGEKNLVGYYFYKVGQLLPNEYLNTVAHILKETDNAVFTDELFEKVLKSPKLMSKILYELRKEGLDIPDMLSFESLFKKYYKNWWDTFVD